MQTAFGPVDLTSSRAFSSVNWTQVGRELVQVARRHGSEDARFWGTATCAAFKCSFRTDADYAAFGDGKAVLGYAFSEVEALIYLGF